MKEVTKSPGGKKKGSKGQRIERSPDRDARKRGCTTATPIAVVTRRGQDRGSVTEQRIGKDDEVRCMLVPVEW